MKAELLLLRVIHIVGGIFWVGGGLYASVFLLPALAEAGAAAGPVMAGLQRRRLFVVLPVVGLLTILSGARLMAITSGGFASGYFDSAPGRTYLAGAIAAIVAFLITILVARPLGMRVAQLAGAMANAAGAEARSTLTTELDAVRRRAARATGVSVALVVFTAVTMSVARYLG